ncbi:hypothetical protein LUX29_05070 [Aureimonas altamirensis]|uniref:hypothetical protein n=1 Tax=Aureimonas altamirensis TaxID=370622 RepID=UPI001E3A49E7|nr:hypothetical protein [Aureimonas altamirensis]UHD46589.1 hypothetical protein LUX29_05070 [Aureimonas altamirensis]
MANRPRRSKASDTTAPKTIDLTAEGKIPAEGSPQVEGPDSAGEPLPEPASAPGAAPEPGSASTSEPTPASQPAPKPETRLPAPSQQPSATAGDGVAEQAASQDRSRATPKPESAAAAKADAATDARPDSATDAFAAEEGFTRPLSEADLSEFEDDETVLSAAAPNAAAAPEAAPYAEPEIHPAPPTTGSLVGAAVGGAVIALVGGGILLYGGLLPGLPVAQPAASQYASAGEVQRLSGDVSAMREVVEQIQSAQAAGGATTSPVSATDFSALSDRVAAAERTLQSGTSASGDLATALDDVRSQIDQVRQAADAAQQAATGAADTANSANEASTAARGDAQQAGQQVASIGSRVDAIESANRNAAIALSAAALKAAIDRGGAFMPELEAYAQASGGGEAVDALRDSAASGVTTLAQLQADWPELERTLLLAVRPETANAPVQDQFMAGLRSLVTVRPEGAASETAEGPEGAVARMDSALRQGDLSTFLSERQTLPEPAQQASADFAARVEARRQAGELVDGALTNALNATTPTAE